MTKDIIVPYLEHLFKACIQLGHGPDRFKQAKTVVLKKSGLRPCHDPSSWRPIALLSSIGKLLERIVAHRLRDLNVQHNILPATQFGVAGRNTTGALRRLLHSVYRAWCHGQYATLLSLDITGVFDRVDREKLLQSLTDKSARLDRQVCFVISFNSQYFSRDSRTRNPKLLLCQYWHSARKSSISDPVLFFRRAIARPSCAINGQQTRSRCACIRR